MKFISFIFYIKVPTDILIIVSEYLGSEIFCNHFKIAYVTGELDAAYRMCEKPYWNVGENFDIPKKLEEVDFKKVFENNMEIYNKSKTMLIASLICEN